MKFSLVGRSLRASEVERIRQGLTGSLYVSSGTDLGGGEGIAEWEFMFSVSPLPPVRVPAVESVDEQKGGAAFPRIEIGIRYDISCHLVPTPDTLMTAEALHTSEFPPNHPLTITLILDGELSERLALQISYSKMTRSLFDRRPKINVPGKTALGGGASSGER